MPFPPPRDLPNPRIEPASPTLAGRFFTTEPPGKPVLCVLNHNWNNPDLRLLESLWLTWSEWQSLSDLSWLIWTIRQLATWPQGLVLCGPIQCPVGTFLFGGNYPVHCRIFSSFYPPDTSIPSPILSRNQKCLQILIAQGPLQGRISLHWEVLVQSLTPPCSLG